MYGLPVLDFDGEEWLVRIVGETDKKDDALALGHAVDVGPDAMMKRLPLGDDLVGAGGYDDHHAVHPEACMVRDGLHGGLEVLAEPGRSLDLYAALDAVVGFLQVLREQDEAVPHVVAEPDAHVQIVPVFRHGRLHVPVAQPAVRGLLRA